MHVGVCKFWREIKFFALSFEEVQRADNDKVEEKRL